MFKNPNSWITSRSSPYENISLFCGYIVLLKSELGLFHKSNLVVLSYNFIMEEKIGCVGANWS